MREGDGGDVHLGAQPLRVPDGVRHAGSLPGAAQPGLASRTRRALAALVFTRVSQTSSLFLFFSFFLESFPERLYAAV